MDNVPITDVFINPPHQRDLRKVSRIEIGDGIYMFFEGLKYPQKGIPSLEAVLGSAVMKRVLISAIRNFKWRIIFLGKKRMLRWFVELGGVAFYHSFLKPQNYCKSVREVHRVSHWIADWQDDSNLYSLISDIFCAILEYDNAYRYMFQDVIVELNQNAKSYTKELKRLIDILYERSVHKPSKILKLKRFIPLLVLMFRKEIIAFLTHIHLDRLALDTSDKYYCFVKDDYNFEGKSLEERLKIRESL